MSNVNVPFINDEEQNKTKSKTTQKRINYIIPIVHLIIFIRFCYPFSASLGAGTSYVIYYGLYTMFFILVSLNIKDYVYSFIKELWPLILIIIVITSRSALSGNTGFGFYDPMRLVILAINFLLAYSIFIYIRTKPIKMQKKYMNTALIGLFISISYSAYYVTFVDYLAVRNATMVNNGVGDFSLIYTILFIPIICIYNLKNSKALTKFGRLGMIILYFMSLYLIIKANFMTALILFLIITFIVLIETKQDNRITRNISVVIIGLLLLIVYTFKESLGKLIISLSNSDIFSWVIKEKMLVIGNILMEKGNDLETLGIRFEKIAFTLESFKSSPLIGINYVDYNQFTIGGHAQWIDDLARFGVIGLLFWIVFYIILYKQALKFSLNRISTKAIKMSWLIFVIIGFLNPNNMSIMTMMLLAVIPFTGVYSERNERKSIVR